MFNPIREIWRRLRTPSTKSVAERIDQLVDARKTVTRYALGSPSPRLSKSYSSVSGYEVDVFIARAGAGLEPIASIQGVSFENTIEDEQHLVRGTMIALVFDATPFHIGDVIDRLVLQWSSEFGQSAWLEVTDLKIVKVGTGVSIDDITTDVNYEFTARGVVGWQPGRRVTRASTWALVTPPAKDSDRSKKEEG